MNARGPVEAPRLTPAASKAVDRGRVGLAKVVARIHGSICVWSRARLSDTTGLSCPRLPGMVLCPLLWEFPPLTTVPTRSYHCAMCVSSWSIPRCPWANTLCCCCLEPLNMLVTSSLPVVTQRRGPRHQVGSMPSQVSF